VDLCVQSRDSELKETQIGRYDHVLDLLDHVLVGLRGLGAP
jgi:hypothetical protein